MVLKIINYNIHSIMVSDMRYFLAALICVLFSATANADIYRYVNDDGIMYFSNIATEAQQKGYTFYMPENRSPEADYKIFHNMYSPDAATQYDEIIRYASFLYEIEYELVKAVIKVESNFKKEAVSHKGACGLMQIMPATQKDLNLEQPFDPQSNILAGTNYLKFLITRFKNNMPLALAAYNAGPGAVERHGNAIPPYAETQNYVRKVLKYYEQFKSEERAKLSNVTQTSYNN